MLRGELAGAADEDPVLANAGLPLAATLYPLGFPVVLRTNAESVLEVARASWGHFRRVFSEKPLRLEFLVGNSADGGPEERPAFRSREHILSITAGAPHVVHCDFDAGYVCGWFTAAAVEDQDHFRYYFLEPAAFTTLAQRYLAPVHGAFVVRNGAGVVLCGDPAVGKSTLAYACACRGWDYVTDDAAYLVRDVPHLYAVANPRIVRFRQSAQALFTELRDRPAINRQNGKSGFEIPAHELGLSRKAGNSVNHLLFLSRRPHGAAKLEPLRREEAFRRLTRVVHHGTQQVREAQIRTYQRLLELNPLTLVYSHFDEAVALLNKMVDGRLV